MEISIAVAVRDEPEAGRKKQGDIIGLWEGEHQLGTGGIANHLMMHLTLPQLVTMEIAQKLMSNYFANGVLNWEGTMATIIAKRRFKIDWAKLKVIVAQAGITVDWSRVEDINDAYQPLSVQQNAPGGQKALFDPTKLVFDKYEARLIKAVDFGSFITG